MTYYAVCDANGPISVELEGDSLEAALLAWAKVDRRAAIDDASADAEDDLGIDGGFEMSEDEFAAALEGAGARRVQPLGEVDQHGRTIAGDWQLWEVSPRVTRVSYAPSMVTVSDERGTVPGARITIETWDGRTHTGEVIPQEGPELRAWLGDLAAVVSSEHSELIQTLAACAQAGAEGEGGTQLVEEP